MSLILSAEIIRLCEKMSTFLEMWKKYERMKGQDLLQNSSAKKEKENEKKRDKASVTNAC